MLLKDAIGQILEAIEEAPEKQELELLLTNIQHYIVKVTQPKPQVPETDITGHSRFNSKEEPISTSLSRELEKRVNWLADLQLPSVKRVTEHLLAGLHPPPQLILTPRQVALVQAMNQNPRIGIVALAKRLRISSRTIKRERQLLFNTYGIHIAGCIDPHRFKLAQFCIYFRTRSIKASRDFEAWIRHNNQDSSLFPFFLGFSFDLSNQEGYFAFLIPQQQRFQRNFHSTIQHIRETFCEVMDLHRLLGCYADVSFDCYDYVSGRWSISVDLRTEGLLQFLQQYRTPFASPHGILYATEVIQFTPADWILAILNAKGFSTRLERRSILARCGYPMAAKTLWSHEAQLYRTNTIFPHIEFSPLAFENIICFFIKCSTETATALHQLASQFAYSRFHPTDQGVVILIGTPRGGPSLLKHLTRTLIHYPGITDFRSLRLQQTIHLIPSLQTHHLWNTQTQLWQNQDFLSIDKK